MFQSSMVRTLIAACIVPLVAIGGPGTPMGMALAAIGEAQVVAGLPTFESRSESTGVSRFSQDADGVSPFGTSALHHPDGIASVVRPDRVLAIESGDTDASQGQAAGARLVDGDAATTLRPERGGAVRVVVHFRRPLWLDGVGLWGDAMGELRLLGATSEIPISEVEGGRSPAGDSSKLRRFVLERPLWGQTFYFEWVPGSLELPSEWTFWQRGSAAELSLGEDAEQLFARGALPGASEYWAAAHETQVSVAALYGQRVRSNDSGAAGAGSAEAQVHVTDLAGKGRAFLVYELEGAPHFTAIRRSINGRAALGGARASGEGAGGLQVEEIPLASLVEGDNTVAFFPANPARHGRLHGAEFADRDDSSERRAHDSEL